LSESNKYPVRIALGIEYDGSRFSGWQRQRDPDLPTVQANLESALSQIADHPVQLVCAGRTDSGVHATCQVVHFNCAIDRGEKAWTQGTNSLLPPTVRVTWAVPVDETFHARFSAEARRYQYVIFTRRTASALLAGKVTHIRTALDFEAMHEAAQSLLGEQDFSSFRAAGCQSNSPNRNVSAVSVTQRGQFIILDIVANAFLQHMVRNIAGALLEIGRGDRHAGWIAELLAAKDRTQGAVTAPPDGLYLVHVQYPAAFKLPITLSSPPILG